jgi:hypothetical protein
MYLDSLGDQESDGFSLLFLDLANAPPITLLLANDQHDRRESIGTSELTQLGEHPPVIVARRAPSPTRVRIPLADVDEVAGCDTIDVLTTLPQALCEYTVSATLCCQAAIGQPTSLSKLSLFAVTSH